VLLVLAIVVAVVFAVLGFIEHLLWLGLIVAGFIAAVHFLTRNA
jgi:hypothetical protein